MAELIALGPPPAARTPAVRAAPAALISLALLGTNALAYVFTVLAARALTPHLYGELAALLGLALVGAVPATGLQTTAALALGGAPGNPGSVVRRLHTTALFAAVCVGVVGVAAIAPVVALLHLPDAAPVGWVVVLLLGHTVVGCYEGVLQGSGRYRRLAMVTTTFGVAKLAGGTAGLLLGGSPTAALAGMGIGAALGAGAGWLGCGRPGLEFGTGPSARATLRASGGLLGFVLLLNLDVLLARHHLPASVAGEYAVASVFAKVAFWLPQGVGVVLLPRLTDARSRDRVVRTAVLVVATVGGGLTLVTAVLGAHALRLVGGSAYGAGLGRWVWLFALLGTLLAAAQLLLYSGIAAADRRAVVAVWSAVGLELAGVEVLAATGRLSALPLAGAAAGTAALLVATGLCRARARVGRAAMRPDPDPED
jgi:O-antigen/teichoic acid export membrane protein